MSHENALESLNFNQEKRTVTYTGLYRAIVRNSFDEDEQGRVKVEVLPMMKGIKEKDLPWAMPKWDLNHVRIPAEGETVWVFFEGGEILKPVYEASTLPVKKIGDDDTTPGSKDEGDPHEWEQHELGDPKRHKKIVEAIQEGEDENKVRSEDPWKEPDMAKDTEYPYNETEISPGGIVKEVDNSPDNRRFHMYFPETDENVKDEEPELGKGNFVEVDKDGNTHWRSIKDWFNYTKKRFINFVIEKMVHYCVGPILVESEGDIIEVIAFDRIWIQSGTQKIDAVALRNVDVVSQGADVTIQAAGNVKVQAGNKVEVEAANQIDVKAPKVNIN